MQMDRTLALPAAQPLHERRLPSESRQESVSAEEFSTALSRNSTNDVAKSASRSTSINEEERTTGKREDHVTDDQDRDDSVEEETCPPEQMLEQNRHVISSPQPANPAGSESMVRANGSSAEDESDADVVPLPSLSTVAVGGQSNKDLTSHQPADRDGEIISRSGVDEIRASRSDSITAVGSDANGHILEYSAAEDLTKGFSNQNGEGDQQSLADDGATQGGGHQDFDVLMTVETAQRSSMPFADMSATAASRFRNLANRIIVQVGKSENGDLDVHMSPDELGALRISFSNGDRTTLVIYAERPETLDLLRRNADSLHRELRDAGLSDFNLDFRWNDSQPGQNDQRPAILLNSIRHESHDEIDAAGPRHIALFYPLQGGTANSENIDIRL
ncbi:flagellar hook-length control protein FliK [Paracoccus sp. DMF-8]|uniref:flagellar hook-length control protein FliK n=1 Tax=Paracoccus sp. DMF-8 TaxID=3019445 RepID=UPI0023E8B2F6|nr:flagellar hook-length control protein FliK [Paracoccus sp. DMF-8]MDF3606482.1 flagellar hook-length control protein FliK [Paracoccus sp. DMF-8]